MKARRLLSAAILLMVAFCMYGQEARLSSAARMLIARNAGIHSDRLGVKSAAQGERMSAFTVIITEDGACVDDDALESLGCTVEKRCGNVIFANVPIGSLETVARLDGIRSVDTGRKVKKMNDRVRSYSMVDEVHEMTVATEGALADVPAKYRGKGVLVAVIDEEIDFGHPAFRNADGTTRIRRALLTELTETGFAVHRFFNETNIEEAAESALGAEVDAGHGTHTSATAAGSTDYLPDGDPAKPYYGMAPEANLLLYHIDMTDSDIHFAVQDAFETADSLGMPLVINMSIGDITAWADGTDRFSMTLKELLKVHGREGKIICSSSANCGEDLQSAIFTCEREIQDNDWTAQKMIVCKEVVEEGEDGKEEYYLDHGLTFYSSDSRDFAVKYVFVDTNTGAEIASTPLVSPEFVSERGHIPYKLWGTTDTGLDYKIEMEFTYEITPANRLFHEGKINYANLSGGVRMYCYAYTKEKGMTIAVCNSGGNFGVAEENEDPEHLAVVPDHEGAMCDIATSPDIISVGAYQTRESFVNYKGETHKDIEAPLGGICEFSSYRTEKYGLPGPDVIAPGSHVFSAYHNGLKDFYTIVSRSDINGTLYPWGEMHGTSMSSPATAGIIALWLQADPTLTVDGVRDIIRQTADYDEFCQADPARAGMGKINALRGLQMILNTSGISLHQTDSTYSSARGYNLLGLPVAGGYKGIVIKDGKKFVRH